MIILVVSVVLSVTVITFWSEINRLIVATAAFIITTLALFVSTVVLTIVSVLKGFVISRSRCKVNWFSVDRFDIIRFVVNRPVADRFA